MSPYLEFDPSVIDKRQIYRLLTGAVVPRPIGWASTVSTKGVANLAPFSFFPVVCVIPPMISLTIARNPDGSEKHTLKNVRDTGEFCFNVVTQPVWKEMVDSANAIPEAAKNPGGGLFESKPGWAIIAVIGAAAIYALLRRRGAGGTAP